MQVHQRSLPSVLAPLVLGLLRPCGCGKGDKHGEKGGDNDGGNNGDRPVARAAAQVSGTVKLADGKPLGIGLIAFHGKDATENAIALVEDGKFVAHGVPVGDKVRVTVDVESPGTLANQIGEPSMDVQIRARFLKQAGKSDAELLKRADDLKDRFKRLRKPRQKVNPDYASLDKSPLSYKVAEGSQTIEIVLQP